MAADRLSPALAEVHAELEANSTRAKQLFGRLGSEQALRRPKPDAWSPAECLTHLTLTTQAFAPGIRAALQRGRREGLQSSGAPVSMGLVPGLLAWFLEPPYRMKGKTGAAFVPHAKEPEAVLSEFLRGQDELFGLLKDAEGLDLARLQIASPFAERLRYNVYAAFRLTTVHQRRHLWQAEQAEKMIAAP